MSEVKRRKLQQIKNKKIKRYELDPDHFTVFNFKSGWEKVMADVWSPDEIQKFKDRQELLRSIPQEQRARTKIDKSYREGWVDAAIWTLQEMKKVFHSFDENKA